MVSNEKVMQHAGDALAAFSPRAELYKENTAIRSQAFFPAGVRFW